MLEDFEPGPRAEASFLVTCSAGTYIRTLAADVGDKLGVGAHLASLRRLGSGRFSLEEAVDIDKVADLAAQQRLGEILITPAEAVADYPRLVVDAEAATKLRHGKPLPATGESGPVAVVDADHRLLAMVEDRGAEARSLVVLAGGGDGS